MIPSITSVVRSRTSTSANSVSARASSSAETSVTSCPAPSSIESTFEPNIRSGTRAITLAIEPPLLGVEPAPLLAHRLGPPPHGLDGDATAAHLTHRDLPPDVRVVEQLQRAVHRRRLRRVPEAVSDDDAPVPVALR